MVTGEEHVSFVNCISFWVQVGLQFFYNLFRIFAIIVGHWSAAADLQRYPIVTSSVATLIFFHFSCLTLLLFHNLSMTLWRYPSYFLNCHSCLLGVVLRHQLMWPFCHFSDDFVVVSGIYSTVLQRCFLLIIAMLLLTPC